MEQMRCSVVVSYFLATVCIHDSMQGFAFLDFAQIHHNTVSYTPAKTSFVLITRSWAPL